MIYIHYTFYRVVNNGNEFLITYQPLVLKRVKWLKYDKMAISICFAQNQSITIISYQRKNK